MVAGNPDDGGPEGGELSIASAKAWASIEQSVESAAGKK